ncbi:MAG: hypothetical protein ACI3W5_03530 [Faecousia sp.]
MNTEERMRAYIRNTNLRDTSKYTLRSNEICAIYDAIEIGRIFEAVVLAFSYGRAKGYRMARRQANEQ